MAKGTTMSQLAETVKQLQGAAEEQTKQGVLMERILQQLNNLASNYDSLVQTTSRRNAGEWTSQNTGIQANPLFEGHGGIQARTLRLDFPRSDGGDPSEWILKSAVSKAVEVGNKNNLTRAVKTYADSVVHHSGQAVAEGAKILQDCIGNRSYKSAKQAAKRLKEVAISCRGKERVLLLRRWVVVLKQFEKLSGGSTEILRAIPNHPNKLGKLHINSIYPKTPTSTRYFTFHAPRKKIGTQINPNPRLPRVMEEGTLVPEPEKILERRLQQKRAKKKNSSSNNNTGNVVEKKEGGENKKGGDGVEKKQENSPVPVVLKVEMHCDGCVSTILKFVRSFEGVESVEAEATSNKLTVTGKVDPLKIRDYLNHKTKKKVELISPQPQKQDTSKNNNNKEDKKSNDKKPDTDAKPKEAPVITAVLKLEFHCQGCIEKIDKIVHKTKGVHERVLDKQKELVTVKGTMDVKALAETLKSRLKRAVDIVPPKKEKEKEKEGGKDGENAAGGGGGKKKGGGGNGGQDAAAAAAATKIEENRMEYMVQPGFGPGYGYVGQPIHGYGYMGQPIHGNGYVGQPVYAPYGPDYRYGYGYGHGPVQGYPDHLQFNDENPNACSIL